MGRYLLILLFSLMSLGGCTSAGGPKFSQLIEPEPGLAIVYLYRPNQHVNRRLSPLIYLDDKPTNPLRNDGFLIFHLTPGKHRISTPDEDVPPALTEGGSDQQQLSTIYQGAKQLPASPIDFEVTDGETLFIAMHTRYQAGASHYTGVGTFFYYEPSIGSAHFSLVAADIAREEIIGLRESD